MKGVQIGHHFLEVPIIQGGMGIGVSLSNLAGNVAANGGMGVISAAQPGYEKAEFKKNPLLENIVALQEEVQKARAIAKGKGMVAINVMAAGNHYAEIVRGCVQTGVDAIISGAGLPLDLPGHVAGSEVLIAPIVSSGKALELLCKAWSKRYERLPDFVVIEGPLAGGHLGFSLESLMDGTATKLEDILQEVLQVLQRWNATIPVFVAGGIFDGSDIAAMIQKGAAGVQMGTRFIATHECDASVTYKQKFIDATEEDVQFVVSPAKLPGRAIMTPFMKVVMEEGRQPVKHCYNCLHKCTPATTPYCISQALMDAAAGDPDNGLVFTGINAPRISELLSVQSLMEQLVQEADEVLGEQV